VGGAAQVGRAHTWGVFSAGYISSDSTKSLIHGSWHPRTAESSARAGNAPIAALFNFSRALKPIVFLHRLRSFRCRSVRRRPSVAVPIRSHDCGA